MARACVSPISTLVVLTSRRSACSFSALHGVHCAWCGSFQPFYWEQQAAVQEDLGAFSQFSGGGGFWDRSPWRGVIHPLLQLSSAREEIRFVYLVDVLLLPVWSVSCLLSPLPPNPLAPEAGLGAPSMWVGLPSCLQCGLLCSPYGKGLKTALLCPLLPPICRYLSMYYCYLIDKFPLFSCIYNRNKYFYCYCYW